MSMTTTITNAVKQRKLSDLRVVDLQRELRSFGILYDKKELKGALLEKLKQALVSRNLDPDTYLFDTSNDLKTISSDENNRSHDENGSHEANILETSNMEVDSEQGLNIENPVQTIATSPTKISTTPPSLIDNPDDEQIDQTIRMDSIDSRQILTEQDTNNIFITIDQSTLQNEDENDKIDHGLSQVSCSSSDEELDTNKQAPKSANLTNNRFNHTTKSSIITTAESQTSSDHNNGEDAQAPSKTPELSTDNDKTSKSEIIRQESPDEQQKKEEKTKINKDQCHLWVSNIAKETHASDLKALFSKHGKVLTTKVIGSSSSQWFGYINLATPDDVEKCINALHQTELHGKKIYVDRDMHDETPSSKSKTNNSSTSSNRHTSSSNTHRKRSDHSSHKSFVNDSYKKRDSITDIQDKPSASDVNVSSNKRSASTFSENRKKLSTSDTNKSTNDEKTVKTHEIDPSTKNTNDTSNEKQNNSSSRSSSQSLRHHTSRMDVPIASEKSESSRSSQKPATNDRKNDKHATRFEKSSTYSTDVSKSKTSSPASHRSHSSEKRSLSSSTKSDHHRSSSIDKSKQHISSHTIPNKYEKPKESHRSTPSNTFDNDRRSMYQNEQRLRHEKEMLVRKQFVQQQEEEKIKEQQRRLAEERERMRREFEMLERDRLEIERTRLVLEKEKQEQAREVEKQQRRLADEAKHRQQQVEAKLRDEKLHRLSNNDNKRPRSSNHEPERPHHSNNNNSNSSNKGYDHRSSTNTNSGRDRSLTDTSRDYYPGPKRQYTNNANNPREAVFRDRVIYRESDLPTSASGLGSSSSIASNNNNQRYLPSSSNQHRLPDPYNNLPQRGRDMALPPSSSVSTAYERSSRNTGSSPTNASSILRRPHSRERYDDREYMQQTQRRDRSPPTNNTLRRDPMETTHWERPKPRDNAHYVDDTHKYLPAQYLSESSQSAQQQQQQQQQQQLQQGLWSSAPPSRQQQQHHHSDLSVKNASHAPIVDPYGWQHISQQVPSQPPLSHHPPGLSSAHDRSRTNVPSNQRIPIIPSNQQPPPPPPSSRGNPTGQAHLYSHPGVPVSALPSSQQQHVPLAPPPPSLHHTAAYVTQQAPPSGLVLHPAGQTRAYEQHYVVTQPLPQRRY